MKELKKIENGTATKIRPCAQWFPKSDAGKTYLDAIVDVIDNAPENDSDGVVVACLGALRSYFEIDNLIMVSEFNGNPIIVEFPVKADGQAHDVYYDEDGAYIEVGNSVQPKGVLEQLMHDIPEDNLILLGSILVNLCGEV